MIQSRCRGLNTRESPKIRCQFFYWLTSLKIRCLFRHVRCGLKLWKSQEVFLWIKAVWKLSCLKVNLTVLKNNTTTYQSYFLKLGEQVHSVKVVSTLWLVKKFRYSLLIGRAFWSQLERSNLYSPTQTLFILGKLVLSTELMT